MEAAPMTHDNPMGGAVQNDAESSGNSREIHLSKPLAFWFGFLIIGVVILVAVIPLLPNIGMSSFSAVLGALAKYILYLPGSIIFPLIVALWIGERVGIVENRIHNALTIGLLNAVYTSLIYAIGIFVVFLVLRYSANMTAIGVTPQGFLVYLLAIPVSILIILIPTFSAMSAARRVK